MERFKIRNFYSKFVDRVLVISTSAEKNPRPNDTFFLYCEFYAKTYMSEQEEIIADRESRIADIEHEPHDFLSPISGYESMPLVTLEIAADELIGFIPMINNYVSIAKQRCKHPPNGLTNDEAAAIILYSMGWKPRDQCLYYVLNSTLRSSNREQLKPWYFYLRLFLNGLFRLQNISKTVYRCVNKDLSHKYPMGKIIVWWGFSLCTTVLNTFQSEHYLNPSSPRTLFIIESHSGKDIRQHSFFPSIDELLLMAGTSFQVIDYLHQENLHIIHLKEIDSIYPLLQPVHILSIPGSTSLFASDKNIQFLSVTSRSAEPMSTHSEMELRSRNPMQNVRSFSLQPTTVLSESAIRTSSSLQFRNPRLERIISAKPNKSHLSLSSMELIDQDMEIVACCLSRDDTKLISLNLENNRAGGSGTKYLSNALIQNKVLTTLNLKNNHIDIQGIEQLSYALQQNTALTMLDLSQNQIDDNGVQCLSYALKHNATLTFLSLTDNDVGVQGAQCLSEALQQNTALVSLSLERNHIGHEGVSYLAKALLINATLTILNLENNQITSEGIEQFSDVLRLNTALSELYLDCNKVKNEGAKYLSVVLRQNKTLAILSLASNDIKETGALYLGEALRFNSILNVLNLSSNQIGEIGAKCLKDALKRNHALTTLNLENNQIGSGGYDTWQNNRNRATSNLDCSKIPDEGIKYLSDALQYNRTLQTLILTSNEIGNTGVEHLSYGLQHNSSLTTLVLAFNRIQHEGAQYLRDALLKNKTLRVLDLGYNDINERGIQYLNGALQQNKTLTMLNLCCNHIDDKGVRYLCDALRNNKTLTNLNLAGNNIGEKGVKLLRDVLQYNSTLITLNLENNLIDNKTEQYLLELKKINKKMNISWLSSELIHFSK
ncbi:unnamed protein product [Adineta ricciae]|uniref:NAD(P)(+)--arginine ADP-ribosyltransferase n=1 Tax=Adineta ricciae TaxID=249248 RepID=A0A814RTE2_ADIRI|nr:unnamed protein product [Adineta ricciae]